jgi:hypothetical protein
MSLPILEGDQTNSNVKEGSKSNRREDIGTVRKEYITQRRMVPNILVEKHTISTLQEQVEQNQEKQKADQSKENLTH